MARERPSKLGQMVVTFPLVDRPKVTRSRGPKVRSGCDTCKKRHLKCDETKPSCHRCLKWRGYCEGYGHGINHEIQLLVEPDSNTKLFKHDWEKKYFDNWNILAAKLGGEWFQLGLFSRIVPQLSHQEPFVRYAAIAVGAMVNAKSGGSGFPGRMGTSSNPHYSAAINCYGRALRLLQSQSDQTSDETAIQRTLLGCLLFACFETLDGSYGTAANHVNHGLKILESFRKYNQPLRSGVLEKAPTLEDEVLQILQRLDYQSWTVGLLDRWRQSSPRVYTSTAPSHRLDETDLPKQFIGLGQARRWWDLVLYRSLHSTPTISGISTPTDDQDDRSQGSCFSASPSSLSEVSDGSPNDDDNNKPDEDPDKIFEIQPPPSDKLTMLETWHTAFLPLYLTARTNQKTDPTPYLQSISLLQQYHIAWICLRTGYFTDYMTLYSLTPRFREIVRLSRILLSHPSSDTTSDNGNDITSREEDPTRGIFTLDNGPTLPLFLTSMKCRDRHVRAQALDLLEKYPRRDAFWSTHAAGAIAHMNVQFEEANEDGGSTLEDQFSRLRMREGVFVDRKRELRGRFFFKEDGSWVRKVVVVRW